MRKAGTRPPNPQTFRGAFNCGRHLGEHHKSAQLQRGTNAAAKTATRTARNRAEAAAEAEAEAAAEAEAEAEEDVVVEEVVVEAGVVGEKMNH
jgi:hypothetical protein